MFTILKFFLILVGILFLIGIFRIGISVIRFMRMVRKLRKGENVRYQKTETKEKKQKRRYSPDGHTIELGKGDYKVE